MPIALRPSPICALASLLALSAGVALVATTWHAEQTFDGLTASSPLGGKSAAGAKAAAPGQPRQIGWDELVPKDWDPSKEFRGMNLSALEDGDPRADALLRKMQDASNNAPTNAAMDGVEVRIPGFIVPLDQINGEVTEFLLVPYFGACIHTPPPPANQILHVTPAEGVRLRAMDTVWVTGRLQAHRNISLMGVSGYRMSAASVTKYAQRSRR